MIATTVSRVPEHTSAKSNARIHQQTDANIAYYANRGPLAVYQRLQELDREWDIERVIQAQAATATLVGLTLGLTVNRKFLAIPALVGGFLWMHVIQGWCPPVPALRRLGFRTASEIDTERYALKTLRGDFQNLGGTKHCDPATVHEVVEAVRR
jgi:hypothetical protein